MGREEERREAHATWVGPQPPMPKPGRQPPYLPTIPHHPHHSPPLPTIPTPHPPTPPTRALGGRHERALHLTVQFPHAAVLHVIQVDVQGVAAGAVQVGAWCG